jgi:hypothetical protein
MMLSCKNWPRPLFRLRTDRASPQKSNPSRETVPLKFAYGTVLLNLLCPTCPLLIGWLRVSMTSGAVNGSSMTSLL